MGASMTSETLKNSGALFLEEEARKEIYRHAAETFPNECCGIVVSDGSTDRSLRLKNMQNERHAADPEGYPRDATIAYSLDELELESIRREAEKIGFTLKAFYHSHPNHDAYFSAEDRAGATPFGEPTYPEAAQIVVSVYDRAVKAIKAFKWCDESRDFVEVPLSHK
jgi:proteasome lid subunit RPN8/RPN11